MTTTGLITVRAGTLLDYRLRLQGVPIDLADADRDLGPPYRVTDTQVRSP